MKLELKKPVIIATSKKNKPSNQNSPKPIPTQNSNTVISQLLTVRAIPSASQIFLNAEEIPNPTKDKSLPAGQYQLKAILKHQGKILEKVITLDVGPTPLKLPIILDLTDLLPSE